MAEIHLVRHGQASFGAADYDCLSPLGEQQAAWLGDYYARRGVVFERVVCGTLRRHHQTAQAICGELPQGPAVETLPGLDEFDFQALLAAAGVTRERVAASDPDLKRGFYRHLKQALTAWSRDELPGPLPETWAAFQQRVAAALAELRAQGAARTLVVSSGGPIGAAVAQILDAPAHSAIELNLQIRNTSVTECFTNAHALRLVSFNALPHLDPADRRHAITYA